MDKLYIHASITLEKGFSTREYRWKSDKRKKSIYKKSCRRAAIRFTCKNLAEKVSKMKQEKRQILVTFLDNENVEIKRTKNKGITMQAYGGKHPYIQIVINRAMPKDLWKLLEESTKKTISFSINLKIDLNDWKDIKLSPGDFLLEIEKEAKSLTKKALNKSFKVLNASKGRAYDLSLIHPNGTELIIAISSHTAKTETRSKEKTIQKILMDISKMLPYLEGNKKTIPIIITRPINFEKSWSFTTDKYLEFYEKKFGFKFLTTEFKKDWEDIIIERLLEV